MSTALRAAACNSCKAGAARTAFVNNVLIIGAAPSCSEAVAAMWPELYGTGHLGAIKSLVASLGVFASALGPLIMGSLLDFGFSIGVICYIFATTTMLGTASMYTAYRLARS